MADWAVELDVPHGLAAPVPQGDLRAGAGGKLYHSNGRQLRQWRAQVAKGAQELRRQAGGVIHGPVGVQVTFTVPRPASIPLRQRAWPQVRSAGDVDKLLRAVLDALTVGNVGKGIGLLTDDALVCDARAVKVYQDTPGVRDRLPAPGAVVRVWML
jgi:Holliday junction resolvase RusA-like endonuclease